MLTLKPGHLGIQGLNEIRIDPEVYPHVVRVFGFHKWSVATSQKKSRPMSIFVATRAPLVTMVHRRDEPQ